MAVALFVVNIQVAKTQLSRPGARVEAGKAIKVTSHRAVAAPSLLGKPYCCALRRQFGRVDSAEVARVSPKIGLRASAILDTSVRTFALPRRRQRLRSQLSSLRLHAFAPGTGDNPL